MCGIHAAISLNGPSHELTAKLQRCLRKRGPDHLGTVTTHLAGLAGLFGSFTSSVLALRGDHVARQPLVDEQGSVLCWNGEAWRIRGQDLVEGNDAEAVLALLAAAGGSRGGVLDALRSVEGPFAFIFYDAPAGRVYYGRDRLGRRSLLVRRGAGEMELSSVAETASRSEWAEVEADGCYAMDLGEARAGRDLVPVRHAWSEDEDLVSSIGVFNTSSRPDRPVALHRGSPAVKQLGEHLAESVRLRVTNVPVPPGATLLDARVAVLFSGGLDCTVLARVASHLLPDGQAIDLLNVAFENPRIAAQNKGLSSEELYELCPDRVTGRKSFAELMAVCPERQWRLITVNVPYAETLAHRAEVLDLIYPHNTEMDLSIAYALYFASRGHGLAQSAPDATPRPHSTTARILLSGLGADELFGGYVRHATAFARGGYPALVGELELDISRLGRRNLGRDDRVMAHWGREVRFPYLDERLARWAVELPAWDKCDFGREEDASASEGGAALECGKKVLRLLAQELGMGLVAAEKKRAIQFGARTAKMENGRVKGTTPLVS
ncbi:Asparagine synthetase domain-containing protein [Escovopsis weberi]|uniref:Asparagine synthetase domain-containing protein n=1 Tax=Escovopsis weberi TaxID=150374 RepID=A0A0M8MY36_ESCWE|nr:Asparagine synthetase domain-containing protein [Escovopsis weberi]